MKPEKIFFTLAVIFLVFVIIFAPLRLMFFSNSSYKTQSEPVIDNLLKFFKGEQELEYFEENEKSHLEDVRVLLNRFFFILYTFVFLFLVSLLILFLINKKEFKDYTFKILFLSGLSSFAILALLFLASLNFSLTFDGFHKLLFPQGNYTFAVDSLLITLFPASFFKSFFLRILISSFILSAVAMAPQIINNKMKN